MDRSKFVKFLRKLYKKESTLWFNEYIGKKGDKVPDDTKYLTISIERVWLPEVRIGLNTFYAALHGSIAVPHRDELQAPEYQVFRPLNNGNEMDTNNLSKMIIGPYDVLESVPYRGSGININIHLFSMKCESIVAPYIKFIKDVSDAAGISFVTKNIPLIDAIHDGVTGLIGESVYEIGLLDHEMNNVCTGFFAVIAEDQANVPENLEFDEVSRIITLNGNHYKDHPYFVIKIDARDKHGRISSIPGINEAYNKMWKQFRIYPPSLDNNDFAFKSCIHAIWASGDILDHDKQGLVRLIEEEAAPFIEKDRTPGKKSRSSLQDLYDKLHEA